LRSNHKQLIQNNNDQKIEANDPLKLWTISAWRTDDVRLWDIMAEIITLTLSPAPINPFRINHAYFETLPLEECVVATGAMMDFLQRVYMKDTPYTDAVYSDIKHLQKLHFVMYDELHSFLTERQNGQGAAAPLAGAAGAAGAGAIKAAGAGAGAVRAGVGKANGQIAVEAAMH
ncbi:hypothetical protein BGX31_009715, partial [Mortierella sp. GBA43]